jgi:hypothetical protein
VLTAATPAAAFRRNAQVRQNLNRDVSASFAVRIEGA